MAFYGVSGATRGCQELFKGSQGVSGGTMWSQGRFSRESQIALGTLRMGLRGFKETFVTFQMVSGVQ